MTFESVLTGIPQILRPLWDRYAVNPVYFVSPEVVENDRCCAVLKHEADLGAEIGTHLHSEFITPEKKYENYAGMLSKEYPCFAYSDKIERTKIENLTDAIHTKIGTRPVSYRAARYGADINTIKALEQLGYSVDSSVTPCIDWRKRGGPDHSAGPDQPYFISRDNYYSQGDMRILEVPITIAGKRLPVLPDNWLFYRWLRPTHMTAREMKALVRLFCRRYEKPTLNMMFHSMEIIPKKTPFVRTKFERRLYLNRLEKIIRHLNNTGFESKTLQEICNGWL